MNAANASANTTDTVRGNLRAQYRTGRPVKEITRLVVAIEGGELVPAAVHADARVVSDNWIPWTDRSTVAAECKTVVSLPAGLLMIDEERFAGAAGAPEAATAAVLSTVSAKGGLMPDWTAARVVARNEIKVGREIVGVEYVVDVAGQRRAYRVA